MTGCDCAAFTSHNRAKCVGVLSRDWKCKNSDDGKANQARQDSHVEPPENWVLIYSEVSGFDCWLSTIANWWVAAAMKSLNAFQG
jgi:hypothetical protein